jgi:hypothetical protein
MEKWRCQVGGDHQPGQCDREGAWGGTLRDAGGFQIVWRADYAGQDCDWRGKKRGAIDPASRAGEGGSAGGASVLRDAGEAGESLGEQLKVLYNQVGSYYPQRENFRLTPDVKEKFTEKLRFDPGSSADTRSTKLSAWMG